MTLPAALTRMASSVPGYPSDVRRIEALGHPSTSAMVGGNYMNPGERAFAFNVSVELFNLPTLPERMADHMTEALTWHLKDAAEAIIDTAQTSLVPGHGYDTGLLHDTLVYRLATHLLATGVYYDLLSEQAYYWRWVEFGHWMRNGQFWEGYHYLEDAVRAHETRIRAAVRRAWSDTMIKLAGEAAVAVKGGL